MAEIPDDERQWDEWEALYEKIKTVLARWGVEDAFGEGDYLIVDDNYGWWRHSIEIHTLKMLDPRIAAELQALLVDYPDWRIVMSVDIPGKESWPPMGIVIERDKIIDGLQRSYLPPEYQNLKF